MIRNWLTVNQFLEQHEGLISRNSIYARIIDKSFPQVRVGNRILIPADALDRLLERTDGGLKGSKAPKNDLEHPSTGNRHTTHKTQTRRGLDLGPMDWKAEYPKIPFGGGRGARTQLTDQHQ